MIHSMYLTMFIMSIALTIIMLKYYKKNISMYYTMLFSCIVIANLGYMQLYSAPDLSAAVFANQVIYLGASFIPYFSFLCIADLCQFKVNKIFHTICMILSLFIFTSVSTIGINGLYYKNVDLVVTADYSYLVKEYGPLHLLYPVYLISMSVIALIIILLSFRKKKMISYITSTTLTVIMTISVASYLLARITGATVDLIPVTEVMMQIAILILLNRISIYDIQSISGASLTNSMEYGFIVCTGKGKFAGADRAARIWFPELNDLFIDYPINSKGSEFLNQIYLWTKGDSSDNKVFERNGRIIVASHDLLKEKNRVPIHFISLRDDTEQQNYVQLMENFNDKLETEVKEKTDRLKTVQNDIIISMASIVENRDSNTGGHIRRTSDIVSIFTARLLNTGNFSELTPEIAECIVKAAPLHDFGKIGVPDHILNKPGRFTDEEYEQMKTHSEKGAVIVARILQSSDDLMFKNIAVNVAHYHHEKWNGKGYPTGLSGNDIPFEARVMALADVFDALVSKRVYKESFGYDRAFTIIEESCGEHFDPKLCEEFMKIRPELETLYNSYTD